MQGKIISSYVDTSVIYPEIENNPASVYSFLLSAGYLKSVKTESCFDGNHICDIAIPNKEIFYVYEKEIICFMHYPPITQSYMHTQKMSQFTAVMKEYGIKKCYYGHLHGPSHKDAIEGMVDGIDFKLISADYLSFDLLCVNGDGEF